MKKPIFCLLLLSVIFELPGQKNQPDSTTLMLNEQGLTMILEGDINQTRPITYTQLQAMKQQQGGNGPIQFGFADHMKYSMKLTNGKDTLVFRQWELPQALVNLVYQGDTTRVFINAFRNPKVSFSSEYKEANEGRVKVASPKAFELVSILLYLSDYGKNDFLPFKISDYAQNVEQHFGPFREHRAIKRLNQLFALNQGRDNQNQLYYLLRMDALGYEFDESNRLQATEHFQYLGGKYGLSPLLNEISDFAVQSGFEEFYEQNRDIYQGQINQYEKSIKVQEIKNWLDGHGKADFNCMGIYLLTLSNGLHNTRKLSDTGFSELIIVLTAPEVKTGLTDPSSLAGLARQLFTELDHHYVNPIGIKHQASVNQAMSALSKWYDAEQWGGYRQPLQVFLEYMTWGLFSAYANDVYPEQFLPKIRQKHREFMIQKRHFVLFEPFENEVVRFHESKNGDYTLEELVLHMIEWMRNH